MIRSLSVRRVPRPLAVVLSAALAAVALPVLAAPASAADVQGFEIDGDLIDSPSGGAADWSSRLTGPTLNDNAPADTTVFSASSKESDLPGTWTFGGQAPSKSDIGNVYVDTDLVGGNVVLRLGWDRDGQSGTDTYFLELNKKPNASNSIPDRSVDDLRFAIKEQGGEVLALALVSKWSGSAWITLGANPAGFSYKENSAPVPLPAGWTSPNAANGTIPTEGFLEVSLDLTTLIGLQASCPPAFGTINFRDATGNSGPSTPAGNIGDNLKDTIAGLNIPAPSTCGTIEIEKETTPATSGEGFGFELITNNVAGIKSPAYSGPITLTTGAGGTISTTYTVAPGDYGFREAEKAGWDLTQLVCNDSDSFPSIDLRTALFKVAPKENVKCTWTNTKRAKLTVKKVTKPAGAAETFTFGVDDSVPPTSPFLATFGLQDGGVPRVLANLELGSYSVQELLTSGQITAGWFIESAVCVKTGTSEQVASGDTTTGLTNVTLTAGADVTCTYTNTKKGVIEVEKQTDPASTAPAFPFTTDVPGWTVGGDGTLVDDEVASRQVVPGTYTVTEGATTGWNLTGILCNDSDSTGPMTTGVATYNVAPGETVRCTYTNTQQGVITVEKQTLPNGSTQDFTFTPSFAIAPGADNILRDGESFSSVGLPPGKYTVSETVPDGWKALTAADIVCTVANANGTSTTSGAGSVTIDLKAGAGVTCVFTNTQKARVIVDKVTNPAGSAQTFPLTGTVPVNTTISDANSFDTGLIDPGTDFSVTEGGTTGWDLTSSECKDQNGVVVGGAKAAQATRSFTPQPGQVITCTYVNTQQAKVVIVKQTDPLSQGGTFDFSSNVPGFGPTVTITVPANTPAGVSATSPLVSVPPGGSAFTVSETAPDGWNVYDLYCLDTDGGTKTSFTPASASAKIDLDPGETVTCFFTNTKLGSLRIGKLTYPPGDPTEFTFDSNASGLAGVALADNDSKKSDPLVAGTYTFQEQPTTGWYQDQVVCRDNETDAVVFSDFVDHDTPPLVSITLGKAQNVTCTVTNVKYAFLQVDKVTNPAGAATPFGFTASGGPSAINEIFNLADTTPVKSIKVKPVLTGGDPGYVVAENTPLPAQWVLTSAVCDNGDAVGNVRPAAGSTVKCTFTNTRSGADLTVTKTATPTYTRTWSWAIGKTKPGAYDLIAGQSVDHDYTVGVTPTSVDSAWKVTGTITVTNPNTYAVTNVTVKDEINNGGVCTVSGQAELLIASIAANSNSGPLNYECTYAAAPNPASGTNTATATWDKTANFTPKDTASGTAPAVFAGPTTEIDESVTVVDDKYDGDSGWTANRAAQQWPYTTTFACPTDTGQYDENGYYTYSVINTATFTTNDTNTTASASATVIVNCSTALVSKTAAGVYDERHEWEITKSVDPASQDQFAGDNGDYTWTVTATEAAPVEENFVVTGSISVKNPSPTQPMVADVVDELNDGTVATIESCSNGTWDPVAQRLTIAANTIATCDYTANPTTRTATKNVVAVLVNGVASSYQADLLWTANVIDGEVALGDDQNPGLPSTITDGGTWTYDDSETCSTNVADYVDGSYVITDPNTATLTTSRYTRTASATATVTCHAPVVSKTAVEDFTRTWNWDIVKETDATYNLVAGDSVTHPYTVDVTPTPEDNFWTVSGEITVTNGHPTEVMVLDGVSDLVAGLSGDIAATVDCPSLEVPAAGSLVCTYTTDPQDSPDDNPFGDLNTATADFAGTGWTGTEPVAFPTDPTTEIDPVVTVEDDKYDGDAGWGADRAANGWTYSTDYACPAPGSAEYGATGAYSYTVVNTATVSAAQGQQGNARLAAAAVLPASDDATVTVNCADGDLVIVKSNTPTGLVPLGSTVTYTLKVGALGTLDQPDVVVTDYIPGYDPAVTGSGLMTYVANSATCDTGAFPCSVAYDDTAKKLTWNIDQINAGETRTLTFQATVDRTQPSIPSGQSGTVTLKNVSAVTTPTEGTVKSNEVQNTANIEIAVLPEVIVKTGVGAPIGPLALVGIVLVGMGVVFTATARRRDEDPLIEG